MKEIKEARKYKQFQILAARKMDDGQKPIKHKLFTEVNKQTLIYE